MLWRAKKTAKSESKLFGRYHDLVMLILGFALTTVVGGILTYYYQTSAWKREDESKRKQDQLTQATATYQELSKLIDRRLFRLRTLQGALENGSKAEVNAAREKYREVVADWNESLNRNLVLTSMYFGAKPRQALEGQISAGFVKLHKKAIAVVRRPTKPDLIDLKNDADVFNVHVYFFNAALLARLQEGRVGTFLRNEEQDVDALTVIDVSSEVPPPGDLPPAASALPSIPTKCPVRGGNPKRPPGPAEPCQPGPFHRR